MAESLVELVRFSAEGLDDLIKNVGNLDQVVKDAHGKFTSFQAGLSNPQVRRAAEDLGRLKIISEAATKAENARIQIKLRGERLLSGAYKESIRERERMKIESSRLDRGERRAELHTSHGRLLGGAMYGMERASPGLLAAGAAGAIGVGMAKSGLSGTVEGNQLAMELHLINREIAAALLPAIKELTHALRWVRQKLGGLSGHQQDMLGTGVLAAAGLGGLGLMVSTIGKAASGLGSILGIMGLRGAGSALGGSLAGQVAGQAAGTVAGNVISGSAGAAMAPAAAGGAAATGALAKGGRLGRFAKGAGRLALPLMAAASIYEGVTGDYYAGERGRGNNKFVSGAKAVGGGFMDVLSTPMKWVGLINKTFGEAYSEKYKNEIESFRKKNEDADKHRNLTLAQGGFESFDAMYERLQTKVSEMGGQAADSQEGTATVLKDVIGPKLDDVARAVREQKPQQPLH